MLLSFVVATVIVCLLPGPSMILVMMNTLQRNLACGVLTILGVVVADALLLALTSTGIGTLVYASTLAFGILKWGGAAYLMLLGLVQLRKRHARTMPHPEEDVANERQNPCLQGVGVTLLNPKIIGFLLAFFPQFLRPDGGIASQMRVLAPLFLLLVFVVLLFYALFAQGIRKVMDTERGQRWLNDASGWSLLGCGAMALAM